MTSSKNCGCGQHEFQRTKLQRPEVANSVRMSRWEKRVAAVGLAVPGAIFALLPKCPLCLAGYVTLATGFGISFSAATHLRNSLIVVSISLLTIIAFTFVVRLGSKFTFRRQKVHTD